MEVRARERLVGALVLVALVVLLVPALLRGPGRLEQDGRAPETKRVEVTLGEPADARADDALMPEPAPPAAAAPAPAATAADSAEPPAAAPAAGPATPRTAVPDPAPATVRAADTPAWAVQLGAFSTRDKAEGLVAQLRGRGYAAFVLEYRAGGQVLHRVRVGPEQDRARAAAIAERLRKDGFQPVVAPHP